MYIYIYARGPRFPQSILVLIDPYVKNHCFARAKCGFCTFFLFILYWQFYGAKFLGPRKLHVMTYYPQYMSIVIFMFSYTKYHFSWISLFSFIRNCHFFYCGTWGNMKRCLFLLVFAVNFDVSMKRHMLIVSLFFCSLLLQLHQPAATCSFSKFLIFLFSHTK